MAAHEYLSIRCRSSREVPTQVCLDFHGDAPEAWMDGAAEPHTGEKGFRPREPSNTVPPFRAQGPGKSALGHTGKHFFTNVNKTGNQKLRKQDREQKNVSCLANVFFSYPVLLTFVIKCFLFCLPAYVCIVFCFLLRLRFFCFLSCLRPYGPIRSWPQGA